jgi:ribosomal protein L3
MLCLPSLHKTIAFSVTNGVWLVLLRAETGLSLVQVEFKVSPDALLPVGTHLGANHFVAGQHVDIVAHTKGKGFQGVMKKHGFKGQPRTHGHSLSHRSIGSIGRQGYSRVLPGRRMAGRMGGVKSREINCWVYRCVARVVHRTHCAHLLNETLWPRIYHSLGGTWMGRSWIVERDMLMRQAWCVKVWSHRSGSVIFCQDSNTAQIYFAPEHVPIVCRVIPERGLLYVKGSLPGPQGCFLYVADALRRRKQELASLPFPTFIGSTDGVEATQAQPKKNLYEIYRN